MAAAGFLVGLGDSTNPWSDSLRKNESFFFVLFDAIEQKQVIRLCVLQFEQT